MARVQPRPTEACRRRALWIARGIFTGHALQTLGMFLLPWIAPWWIIVATFGFILWLNIRYRGCPWTRTELRYRRLSGWKGFGHALIGRLLMYPLNVWKPEKKRRYPSARTVNAILLASVIVIVGLALYRQGLTPCNWWGVFLKGC